MSRISTRQGFGDGMMQLVNERDDILMVAADTYRSFALGDFVKTYPDRYFEFGIAEQNMLDASAGLVADGEDIVFAVGYSPFLSLRALEQIRTFVAYPGLNVKVVAGLSGLSGDSDGVTHQGTEDLGIIRSIPKITLVCPADYVATKKYVKIAAETPGAFYLRIGRSATDIVYDENQDFTLGKAIVTRDYGTDAVVIACGPSVGNAVLAAEALKEKGINIRVIDAHSLKPFDEEAVLNAVRDSGKIITVEDGTIYGGLGSAVAEVLAEKSDRCVNFRRLGLTTFGTAGELDELFKFFGIGPKDIVDAVEAIM